ncbi:MAG: membrane-associated Zn-dependent protease [Methanosphaera sp. rholeuAM270]|nr:MAG: membrane-associated Zn-dependent protease [Methanosphaera sp. rholeuAM270]
MNALWYYVIGFVVVWILAFLLKDKYNISFQGIILMLKTERLHDIIDKIAKRTPRFWKTYMNIGIPIGFFLMILMLVSLILSLQLMFETPTVSLILPGVDVPGSPIYIPFATGLLALATVLVIHEGGHGVLARVENVKIDSVGLLLFLIIPGAFVEPNEDELKKINGISKLRIYFAGPMFNMGLAVIGLILMLLVGGMVAAGDFYTSDGMEISSVVPSSPSEGILSQGMVIKQINNQNVTNTTSYTAIMNKNRIGDNVSITTDTGTYHVVAGENPNNSSKAYLGVRSKEHTIVTPEVKQKYGTFIPWLLTQLRELFYLIFFLNFAVGTFNLLPMKPLDGGLILEEVLGYRIRDDRRKDFNNTLNYLTNPLPRGIRCILSRLFNCILDFLHNHELEDETVQPVVKYTSYTLIAILLVLILYGMLPGILQMI